MAHPYSISQADRGAGAQRGQRASSNAPRGPLTQASLSTQLEYGTQGTQGGYAAGFSQESLGLGGPPGINGFHSQSMYDG